MLIFLVIAPYPGLQSRIWAKKIPPKTTTIVTLSKMAPSPLQQRRTHNTLLFQKLLNLRDGTSPFTLVLDTLEQSGGPVVREFARRAKVRTHFSCDSSCLKSSFSIVSFCHHIFLSISCLSTVTVVMV